MHPIELEETMDLFSEVEKWYEGSNAKEKWVSAFNRTCFEESLIELDDFMLNTTSSISSENSYNTPESTCNTKPIRCLMEEFETLSPALEIYDPRLCSTPISRHDRDIEELRLVNQSADYHRTYPNKIQQETMTLLATSPSYLSTSLDSLSFTIPNNGKIFPELEFTNCSSLGIVDLPSLSTTYILDPPPNCKDHQIIDSFLEYTNKDNLLLDNKHPLHISLSLSHFEMLI